MSKKHFIALADHIKDHNKYGATKFTDDQIEALANFCRTQNSQFLPGRWKAYIKGECGPNGGDIKKS